ncbi:tRNA pseudouridine(13) synthase [Malassezia brasiliensis]|uniref:tRNA pseudouridine(13) synthase n=1 Tax=Malassezia brasiliensis TaxID=1821822 RepID=A0AAF0ISJ4_9BASI|nr:tRNA pseudouridine(13) synthase [Malassezia brasiliensis]
MQEHGEDAARPVKRARTEQAPESAPEQAQARMVEQDAGMTQYVHPGWTPVHGIIKQRYADFLVHEIAPDGQVVHITSLAPPEGEKRNPEAVKRTSEDWDALQPWFSDQLGELKKMAAGQSTSEVTSARITDKAERTRVHQLIRTLGGGSLASEAASVDDAPVIRVKRMQAARGGRSQRDPTSEANRSPPYIHFLLQKTNRDSQEALQWLSRFLHLDHRRGKEQLSVAGTKDKRAVTVQKVALQRGRKTLDEVWRLVNHIGQPVSSAPGTHERRTVELATTTRAERGLRIAQLAYADAPLQLGMLAGNQFSITLRNVHWVNEAERLGDKDRSQLSEALEKRVTEIQKNGFVNYFGMQRFGTGAVSTHVIGIAILRGDFNEALRLLLSPEDSEDERDESTAPPHVVATRAGRKAYAEGRYEEAYRLFPKICVAERAVLDKMRMPHWHPSDALGAFQNIPRSLRLMYVHAYQSYLWNSLVSERIRRFGAFQCVSGDYVADRTAPLDASTAITVAGDDAETKHSIEEVVMPMPGGDVVLPASGWMAEMYTELLAKDGLTPSMLSTSKQPEYRLKGSYRRIVQKPQNARCELIPYEDADAPLCETDEEKLLPDVHLPPRAPLDAPFLALQLTFQLPPSSYATILLRELLRMDTSAHKQKELTKNSADQKVASTHSAPAPP